MNMPKSRFTNLSCGFVLGTVMSVAFSGTELAEAFTPYTAEQSQQIRDQRARYCHLLDSEGLKVVRFNRCSDVCAGRTIYYDETRRETRRGYGRIHAVCFLEKQTHGLNRIRQGNENIRKATKNHMRMSPSPSFQLPRRNQYQTDKKR